MASERCGGEMVQNYDSENKVLLKVLTSWRNQIRKKKYYKVLSGWQTNVASSKGRAFTDMFWSEKIVHQSFQEMGGESSGQTR